MSDRLRSGLTVFMLIILAGSAFAAGYLTRGLVNGRESSLARAQQDDLAPVSYTHLDVYKRQA